MLSIREIENVGPNNVAHHAYYMKQVEERRKVGLTILIKRQHF